MKKKFKLLLAPLALTLGVTLVACGSKADPTTPSTPTPTTTVTPSVDYDALLRSLVIDQNGKTVSEDFDVPAKVQDTAITWSSSNEGVVKFIPANDGKTVKAGVIIPTEATTVTLTAKVAEGKTKEFKVKVLPIDVYSFMDAYKFGLDSGVFASEEKEFTTDVKIKHESVALSAAQEFNATVSFTSANTELVNVDATNKKFIIGSAEEVTKVKVTATFTYNNETASKDYNVQVWHELTNTEKLHMFYDNVGELTYDVYGYVISKAGWNDSYKNGYVFMADVTREGGFYVYRGCMEKEVWDTLEFGTPIKAAAMKSTLYSGLVESNGNIQISVVNDTNLVPALTADQKAALKAGTAADDLVFGNFDQTKYLTGTVVTLTGWKVEAIKTAEVTAKTGGSLLKVSKSIGETKVVVDIQLSKYAVDLDTAAATAVVNAVADIKVGDFVNVKGLLSNYNGWQLYATEADWVAKGTDSGTTALVNSTPLVTFKTAFDDVAKTAYAGATTVNLPEGATYSLKKNYSTVTLADGVLTINPGEKEETCVLYADFESNGLTYKVTREFTTRTLTDAEKVLKDVEAAFPEKIEAPVLIELPETGKHFESSITWTLVDGAEIATLTDGKLTIFPTATEKTIKIGYVATLGNYTTGPNKVFEISAKYVTKEGDPTPTTASYVLRASDILGKSKSYVDATAESYNVYGHQVDFASGKFVGYGMTYFGSLRYFQLKKNAPECLTVKNITGTKLTVVYLSTFDFNEKSVATIKFGDTVLTANETDAEVQAARIATGEKNNNKDAYYYVVTYDLSGTDAKDLVFAGNKDAAVYIGSISVE